MNEKVSAGKYGMEATSLIYGVTSLEGMQELGNLHMDRGAWSYSMGKLVEIVSEFSRAACGDVNGVDRIVREFFEEFMPSHRSRNFPQQGSTSLGGLLSVYFLARKLSPRVIVESGVFVGASLHALRSGAPNAKIFAFDVSFRPLKYRDESITYLEADWAEAGRFDGEGGFAFFDDHTNNAVRILEARERGLRYLLFDDAPKMGEITQYRYPGVPTVPMIMDEGLGAHSIGWKYGETLLRYDHDPDTCKLARSLIDIAIPFPDLRPIGLFVGHKWFVRLKDRAAATPRSPIIDPESG